jgi:serine/threonine-protein kinase
MTGDRREGDLDFSLARARWINSRCEQFEAAWRNGDRPSIATFLGSSDGPEQLALFRELLALEIELRREHGEDPTRDEYLGIFAHRSGIVAAVFSEFDSPAEVTPTVELTQSRRTTSDGGGNGAKPATTPGFHQVETREVSACATMGEYELIEEIARGGMGVVYKARHKGLKRLVALKMILSGPMATDRERERFRREAELAANLDHPNIVPIFEVDEHQGRPFFSMKLVEGANLAKQVKRFTADPDAAARLVSTLARAVHHAHGQGFLHCDLKPSNVLLDSQAKPYLTDFGLARRTGTDSSLSATGTILGTPSYMAPEQAAGSRARLGPATDVYGLGAVFYELLTGRPPFRTPTIMETVVQVLERDPAPPRGLRREIPLELESICLKCLEKSPKDRYASAAELADELDSYLHGEGIAATGIVSRLRRWNRREPELVARLGGLAIVAVLTQYNYVFLSPEPSFWLHYLVQAVLALWALSSVLFQALSRQGWRSDRVRVLWSACDIVFLTIELKLLGRVETTLLAGYPLLIAASGLWWRVHQVWITTLMAMIAYCVLYLDAALIWHAGQPFWRIRGDLQYPNIFLAALLLTGYIVVRQIKRILALSRYYENRSEP